MRDKATDVVPKSPTRSVQGGKREQAEPAVSPRVEGGNAPPEGNTAPASAFSTPSGWCTLCRRRRPPYVEYCATEEQAADVFTKAQSGTVSRPARSSADTAPALSAEPLVLERTLLRVLSRRAFAWCRLVSKLRVLRTRRRLWALSGHHLRDLKVFGQQATPELKRRWAHLGHALAAVKRAGRE